MISVREGNMERVVAESKSSPSNGRQSTNSRRNASSNSPSYEQSQKGEAPLYVPSSNPRPTPMSRLSSSWTSRERIELHCRQRRHLDAGWPLAHHELSSIASSFRSESHSSRVVDEETLMIMSCREEVDSRDYGIRSAGRTLEKQRSSQTITQQSPRMKHGRPDVSTSMSIREVENHGSVWLSESAREGFIVEEGREPRRHSHRGLENNRSPVMAAVPSPAHEGEVLPNLRHLKPGRSTAMAGESTPRRTKKDSIIPSASREDVHSSIQKPSVPKQSPRSSSRGEHSNSSAPSSLIRMRNDIAGELEIMPGTEERRWRLRGGERRAGYSIQDQIIDIRMHSWTMASCASTPSPDHALSVSAAIPFNWEEEPGKPKTIAAAAQRALARRLSREGIDLNSFLEGNRSAPSFSSRLSVESDSYGDALASELSAGQDISPARNSADLSSRSGSHRYYSKHHSRGHSREKSLGRSSRRYSTHEKDTHIDLVAPSAARFLVETFVSPATTPKHVHTPPAAVPFKWEETPGKAKADTATSKPHALQLPPRLAIPLQCGSESFSRDLRIPSFRHFSAPFAGLFTPCLSASSPARPESGPAMAQQYGSSRSLPPKVPPSPSRHTRHGFVGNCRSAPQEGCHIKVSRSADKSPVQARVVDKAFSGPLPTSNSPILKPRKLFSAELKASHPWMQKANPSSPTSTLCGPDEGSSQTSASIFFSSGDLESFTQVATPSMKSRSKSSSSASFESIEEDFEEQPSPSYNLPPLFDPDQCADLQGSPFVELGPTPEEYSENGHSCYGAMPGASDGMKALLKLCRNGNSYIGKPKSRQRLNTIYSPEVWAPTLATYFQCVELNQGATSSGLLNKQGEPTSSGYLNTEGEPIPLTKCVPDLALASHENSSPDVSPKRPTRLPYTMPTVAEQELAARDFSKPPNSDFSARLGATGRFSSNWSRPGTPARVERFLVTTAQASHGEDVCPSPAYAAALELLSPAVNLIAQRRKGAGTPKLPSTRWPGPKARKRVRFIVSKPLWNSSVTLYPTIVPPASTIGISLTQYAGIECGLKSVVSYTHLRLTTQFFRGKCNFELFTK